MSEGEKTNEEPLKICIKGNKIPSKRVKRIWKECFPLKIMPKILAFNVTKDEYIRIRRQVIDFNTKQGENPYAGEISEYGRPLSDEQSTTGLLKLDKRGLQLCDWTGDYLILRRIDSWVSEKSDLRHEIIHIGTGEYTRLSASL